MSLTTSDCSLSLPSVPDTSSPSQSADQFPTTHDAYAQRTAARRSAFVRVDVAALPGEMGEFKQIKLTIQRSIIYPSLFPSPQQILDLGL